MQRRMVAAVLLTAVVGSCGGGDDTATPTTSTTAVVTTTSTPTSAPSTSTTTSTTPASTTTSLPRTTTTKARSATTTSVTEAGTARVVQRGDATRRRVALTFDAGSDAGNASRILDTLRAEGVPATFGITGRWAQANQALVARMVREGHQLVNHSYDHPSFTGRSTGTAPLTRAERVDQLARAEAALRAAAGGIGSGGWFRPPYGDRDAGVDRDVRAAGYGVELLWTVDSLGWKGIRAADVTARCLGQAVPGAIFLFHVGAASTDADALPSLLSGLREAGYGFATAAALLG